MSSTPSAAERGDAAASPQPADDLARIVALITDDVADGIHDEGLDLVLAGFPIEYGEKLARPAKTASEYAARTLIDAGWHDGPKPCDGSESCPAEQHIHGCDADDPCQHRHRLATADELAARQFMADYDVAISDAEADRIIYIARCDKAVLDAARAHYEELYDPSVPERALRAVDRRLWAAVGNAAVRARREAGR